MNIAKSPTSERSGFNARNFFTKSGALLFLALCLSLLALLLPAQAKAASAPVQRALFIYGDKYAYPFGSLGLTPRNDAQLMSETLASVGVKDATFGAPESMFAMQDMIKRAYAGATQNDISYFYYSGHGDTQGGEACLILSDGKQNFYVTATWLEKQLRQIPGKKVLILDACNTGGAMGKSFSYQVRNKYDAEFTQSIASPFRRSLYRVIAASSFTEFAWSDYRYSDFTYAFATAMGVPDGIATADSNGDQHVSINELRATLRQSTISATVQTYPESSNAALFSYADSARTPALQNFSARESVVDRQNSGYLQLSFKLTRGLALKFSLYTADEFGPDILVKSETIEFSRGSHVFEYRLDSSLDAGNYVLSCAVEGTGAVYWHTFEVVHEGQPDILLTTRQRSLTADGAQELDIRVGFDAGCAISVYVANAEGIPVRSLANEERARPLNNPTADFPLHYNQYFWDGRSDGGNLVAAGKYTIVAKARVNGATAEESVDLQVSRVTPRVSLSLPETFTIQDGAQFRFNVSLNTEGYLNVYIRNERGIVARVYESEPLGPSNHRLVWDGTDDSGYTLPAGEYTVRATIRAGGQTRTEEKPFTIEGVNRIVGRAAVDMSATAGGKNLIDMTMRTDGKLSIYLLDGSGQRVATIAKNRSLQKGAHKFTFNGLDADGEKLPSGKYRLAFLASSGTIVSPALTRSVFILHN